MTRKTRRRFSPEQRSAILRRHLVDKVAVSDLCDEYSIQPSLFYGWQKQLDALAKQLDRSRNYVVSQAIAALLDTHAWQVEQIEKGLAEARCDVFVSDEEM